MLITPMMPVVTLLMGQAALSLHLPLTGVASAGGEVVAPGELVVEAVLQGIMQPVSAHTTTSCTAVTLAYAGFWHAIVDMTSPCCNHYSCIVFEPFH
jgi:hypothetical protein